MNQDKPSFRAQYFRDLYKTLLITSSGTAIAAVTFVQNLRIVQSKNIFTASFFLLTASICIQLLVPLFNVISAGLYWDGENYKDDKSSCQSSIWGKASGLLMIIGILLTVISIILLSIFAGKNI